MSGLETNLKSTRPRAGHYETKTETANKRARPRPRPRPVSRLLSLLLTVVSFKLSEEVEPSVLLSYTQSHILLVQLNLSETNCHYMQLR